MAFTEHLVPTTQVALYTAFLGIRRLLVHRIFQVQLVLSNIILGDEGIWDPFHGKLCIAYKQQGGRNKTYLSI